MRKKSWDTLQEEEKVSTIKRNGNLGQSFEQVPQLFLLSFKSFYLSTKNIFSFSGDEGEATAGGGGEEEGGRTTDRLVVLTLNPILAIWP